MRQPLLPWVGGKRRLVRTILEMFPQDFGNYWEPFCGGCSVAYNIGAHPIHIGDANPYLINLYKALINPIEYEQVVCILQDLDGADYYTCRDLFNSLQIGSVERAALFYWLILNSYRNIVQFNQSGEFNAGGKDDGQCGFRLDLNKLEEFADWLLDVFVYEGDFCEITAQKGDLVYLDPPYDNCASNNYTYSSWGEQDTLRLKEQCEEWDKEGVLFLLSNHDTDFVRSIFGQFNITRLRAKRSIGPKSEAFEVLVSNYGCPPSTIATFRK
jgi:DNA adenine methylase